jgi:Predicted hydrolases of the HAD superfamily
MKDIKIIFFDIDGTLIAMDKDTISDKTLEALKRLQANGIKLCLATGRGPMLVPHFDGVEFDAFLTYNGSYCYDHEGTLYRNCIPSKDIETIVNNAVKIGRPVALATKDRMAANGKDQDLIDYYAFGNAEVEVAKDFRRSKKRNSLSSTNGCKERRISRYSKRCPSSRDHSMVESSR